MKKICLGVLLMMLALLLLACDVEVHVHSWGEPEITENGDKIYTCTGCSKTKTEEHEHTWGEPVVNANGDAVYVCSVCQKTKTEEHEHKYQTTYTSDLAEHWCACSVEGCLSRTLQASHEWDNGTVTKKPTEEAKGERTYACLVCGRTRKEAIAKLPIKMPRFEWVSAFAFDNVKVEYVYRDEASKEDYRCSYLIDGALVQMVDEEGTDIIDPELLLPEFDFSDYYDAFVHNGNGVYTAEYVECEYWVLVDVRVIFVDGVLDSISYSYDDEEDVRHSYSFSDWGEIEVALPVLGADTLEGAFDTSNFENYTVGIAEMTTALELLRMETWMFNGADFGRYIVGAANDMDAEYGTVQNAGWVKLPELAFLATVLEADNFVYDPQMGAFVCGTRFENFMDTGKDVVSICLEIEDGYLTYLVLTRADGVLVSYYFTDYGVTEIIPEDELEEEQPVTMTEQELTEALATEKFSNYTYTYTVMTATGRVTWTDVWEFDEKAYHNCTYDESGDMINEECAEIAAGVAGWDCVPVLAELARVANTLSLEYDAVSGCFYSELTAPGAFGDGYVALYLLVEEGYLSYLELVDENGICLCYVFEKYGTTEIVIPE